ncbi:hypothetical protein DICVIV_11811 [Dictyocaulus viviparus]|uniref:Uncharacterized protein n=1 Tax=Dictyocaulus viviparus TaxID=29172 RepID=A0A0D8XEV7_DICVI|nr:hypothetical protein DICVIV_11811 [Dictyocaulus viviparus]
MVYVSFISVGRRKELSHRRIDEAHIQAMHYTMTSRPSSNHRTEGKAQAIPKDTISKFSYLAIQKKLD